MSETQNTALVKGLYAAFGNGDIQTIMDSVTEDVEWNMEGPEILPFSGKRIGKAQVLAFFEALAGTQSDVKVTTHQFLAQGDHVATCGRYAGTVTTTGKKFDIVIAHFFTLSDGKVTRFDDIVDTAALADSYRTTAAAAR
jgi:uncharacterized protein